MDVPSTHRPSSRFMRVLAHIDGHLEDELSVEWLGDVAALSKFHFHRQFSALFGLGVYRYIQLKRLKRAAYRLAFRDDGSVLSIALDSGYDGPEAFARAFKKWLGQTPREFRNAPDWGAWHSAYHPMIQAGMRTMSEQQQRQPVRIIDFKPTRVASLEHRGDPRRIGDSVRTFIAWRRQVGLPPRLSATYNVLYGDPAETPPEAFRLELCAATDRPVTDNPYGIVARTLPGGRCAVLRHIGSDDGLTGAIRYLHADWLPASGEHRRDAPPFCQRVRFFPDVAEHEAITDIFLPLI